MSTIPIALSVTNNFIAVADVMKSVSVIEYKRGKDGEPDQLKEVARHFQVVWVTAMVALEDDTFLQSDTAGNLMVLHRDVNGVTEDDKRMLKVTSELKLGEMVNKIERSKLKQINFCCPLANTLLIFHSCHCSFRWNCSSKSIYRNGLFTLSSPSPPFHPPISANHILTYS